MGDARDLDGEIRGGHGPLQVPHRRGLHRQGPRARRQAGLGHGRGIQVEGVGAKILRVLGDRTCVHQARTPPALHRSQAFHARWKSATTTPMAARIIGACPAIPSIIPATPWAKAWSRTSARTVEGLELPNLEDPGGHADAGAARPGGPGRPGRRRPCPRAWDGSRDLVSPQLLRRRRPALYRARVPSPRKNTWACPEGPYRPGARGCKLPGFHPRFIQGASPGLSFPPLRR